MEKKYKVVVIDNETTEVKHEFDSNIFFLGVDLDEGVNITSAINGSPIDTANVIFSIEKHIAKLKQEYSQLDLLVQFLHYKHKNGGEGDE